jgi:putative nucleotidyltransferase with HDIG domain
MDKKRFFWNSLRFKVTAAFIAAMLFVGLFSNALVYKFTLGLQFQQLQERLKMLARTAAVAVDVPALMAIPLNKEGMSTPEYRSVEKKLRRIRQDSPLIRDIYILSRTTQEGIWQFVVDPDPVVKRRYGITSYPGDKYNASRFPAMIAALREAAADDTLEKDEWGVTLSGYAPVRDASGTVVAVLGVDMAAQDVYLMQQGIKRRVVWALLAGMLLSVFLGLLVSGRVTGPVEALVEGTRRISQGDLDYKVAARHKDELGDLADAFNRMAADLKDMQVKNQNYFYQVIQSLVRIVEAKDHYTRGHSERVAEYSREIARKMNFSALETEILAQTAVLHDIGKLAVHDEILNKQEKLSSEEWEVIRSHPVIGEDILRPVSISPEMLAIVRGHHERVDGTGYPDNLSGGRIHIFAQILSVADAYDAMTSSRAYRPAMAAEKAIAEMKKNSGTQFNAGIVDILIEIIKEKDQGQG